MGPTCHNFLFFSTPLSPGLSLPPSVLSPSATAPLLPRPPPPATTSSGGAAEPGTRPRRRASRQQGRGGARRRARGGLLPARAGGPPRCTALLPATSSLLAPPSSGHSSSALPYRGVQSARPTPSLSSIHRARWPGAAAAMALSGPQADGAARSLARAAATAPCSSRNGRKELPQSARCNGPGF